MPDGFNLQDDEDTEQKREQQRKEKEKELENTNDTLRVEDGLNVFHVVPALGETLNHHVYKLVHFRPFHLCSRPDILPDSSDEQGYKGDKDFSKCYRDQKAFDQWDNEDRPDDGPYKLAFRRDMPNARAFMQIVDFSDFFRWNDPDEKLWVELKEDVYDRWFDTFLDLVLTPTEEIDEDGDIPDDMPEEMADRARLSPDVINVSVYSVGKDLLQKFKRFKGKRKKKTDPYGHPDQYLLRIDREKSGQTFPGAGGQKVEGRSYDIDFLDDLEGWEEGFPKEDYLQGLLEVGVDIENMEPEDDSLEARALALQKFTEDEMKEYLEENDHSFKPDTSFDTDEMDDEMEDPDNFDDEEDDFDPDNFQEQQNVLTTEDVGGEDVDEDELDEELADV